MEGDARGQDKNEYKRMERVGGVDQEDVNREGRRLHGREAYEEREGYERMGEGRGST